MPWESHKYGHLKSMLESNIVRHCDCDSYIVGLPWTLSSFRPTKNPGVQLYIDNEGRQPSSPFDAVQYLTMLCTYTYPYFIIFPSFYYSFVKKTDGRTGGPTDGPTEGLMDGNPLT